MAMGLASVLDGLGGLVTTLWGLQERRFAHTFEAVTSAMVSMTMAFLFCFLSFHRHRRAEMGMGGLGFI